MRDRLKSFDPVIQKTLENEANEEIRNAKLLNKLASEAIKCEPLVRGNIISGFLADKVDQYLDDANEIVGLIQTQKKNLGINSKNVTE